MIAIQWLAQACVALTCQSKDKKSQNVMVMDPYGGNIGFVLPKREASVVSVSHDHADHNNVAGLEGSPFVVNEPGEYEVAGFSLEAIPSFHDNEGGKARGQNLIVRVQTPEISLVHFGDFGQAELTSEQLEALGDVDIAFIPVGGTFTVDGMRAAKIISQLEPKVAIPIHYQIPGLTIAELAGPESFFEALGQKPTLISGEWKVKVGDLPSEGTRLIQLEPQGKRA